jgi:cytidylate kinase
MQYRALTVSREFGSGGGRIANTIADWLGWKLLDNEIITAIANTARVDSQVVRHYDERVDSWLRRLNEEAIRGVAMAAGRPMGENEIFDTNAMTRMTRQIIEDAYKTGNCVVVGRGSQCILEHKKDVFHVFVFASLRDRMHRLQTRLKPGIDIAEKIRIVDTARAKYFNQLYGRSWCDHRLYDLMIRSEEDEDATARKILYAMTGKA